MQIIQSLDGGIVEEILVKPGQEVEAGQILLKIDSTRFASSLGENNAEYLSLLAKSARLKALATGEPFVAPEEVLKQAPNLIEMERNAWQARTSELNATVNVAREQLKQRQEELRETIAKRDQASASCGLTSRELQVTRPLLKSGAVSEVDLLRLQRDVARYCGEQKGAEAQIDRIQASIKEAQSKLEESELNIRNQARNELSETNTKLSTLREGKLALADRVKLAEVRAGARHRQDPVQQHGRRRGAAGQGHHRDRAQDDTLLLEVRILPRDIGFLHADQKAEVKFTAYDFAIYGGLEGKVEQIGADTVTDEKGNSYYVVRVRTDRSTVGTRTCPSSRDGGRGSHPDWQAHRAAVPAQAGPARQGQRLYRALTPYLIRGEREGFMKSVPVLLITHDDLLWQRWRELDPERWLVARGRGWPTCSAGATRAVPGRAGRRPAAAAVLAGRRLGADPAGLSLLVASASPHDEQGTQVLAAGAQGYCHSYARRRRWHRPWRSSPRAASDGPFLVSRLLRLVAEKGQDAGDWDGGLLTERETTAARYAAGGWANAQIAEALGITERTVKAHLSAVFEKLGVSDRLQLALLVHGISSPSESRSKIPPELSSRTIPRPAGLL